MQNITSSAQLKEAILLLEVEQIIKGRVLKQQFRLTYESLKPVNLFLNALKDITTSPGVADNLLGTAGGIVTGFLSKKIFVGTSVNLFRKLIGSLMQVGVTNLVSNHPDGLKTFGQFVIQQFMRMKERRASTID